MLNRGKIDALPAGYLAAEFLESTGTQYIKATAIFNNNTKLEMLARQTGSSTNSAFFGTEHMYTADVATKRFSCMVQGSPGHLRFDYGSRTDFSSFYIERGVCYKITKDAEKNYIDGVLVYSNPPAVFDGLYGALFTRGAGPYNANGGIKGAIYWCNVFNSGKPEHAFVPALTEKGVPCMYDKVTKTPFLNSGSVQFIVGMTCKQALKLAELPAGGGSLTVSLPWEAQLVQHNAEVEAALQTAKANGWTITVQYRDPEPDNALYNKYAECVTVADMQAVNADYKNDLTPAGEWVYPMPKLQNASWAFNTFEKCKAWLVDLPSLTNGEFMLVRYAGAVFDRALPLLENGESMFRNMVGRKTFKSALPRLKNGIRMFAGVAAYGIVYLSFESDLPMLEKGLGMFDLNALDKASVLRICSSIPTYTSGTHELTLGIHIDHQTDDEVLSAIAEAEAKGWIMTVQWNGTPTAQTASTFGLRKPPIYAKVGSMVLPDSTDEQYLDWGHYVTNWEARGYQEFTSLEEAKEHFNVEN